MMVEVSLLSGKQEAGGQEDKIDKLKLSFEQRSNLDIESQSTWDYSTNTISCTHLDIVHSSQYV